MVSNTYTLQQQPPGFDPTQHNWNQMQPNISVNEFEQRRLRDPLIEGLHRHPHLVEILMKRLEKMIDQVVERVLVRSGLIEASQVNVAGLRLQPIGAQKPNEINMAEGKLNTTIGRNIPQDITSTLDVKSEHFFQELLTDDHINDLMDMSKANHDMAIQTGYFDANHQDPNQATALVSPFGQAYQTPQGQWAYQPHAQPPWGQQGYSPAPPGLFTPRNIGGALLGSLLGPGV